LQDDLTKLFEEYKGDINVVQLVDYLLEHSVVKRLTPENIAPSNKLLNTINTVASEFSAMKHKEDHVKVKLHERRLCYKSDYYL
jgi:hypothetical protein